MLRGRIYVNHCTMEGLALVGNIQGSPADALVAIFDLMSIGPVLKWVYDFILFCTPSSSYLDVDGVTNYIYSYDLPIVMDVTDPLGVPWNPFETKGQDFKSMVSCIGFFLGFRVPLHLPVL